MIQIRNIFSSFLNEILIVILFLIVISNLLGRIDQRINADAKGYYDYLPSIFIYHDFVRCSSTRENTPEKFRRIDKFGVYNDYGKQRVNQYTCGTALLESPFFLTTLLLHKDVGEAGFGYNKPFQMSVFYAALFYLFLSLYFFKKLLQQYNIGRNSIIFTQLLPVFATSVTHYAYADPGFSHIFSLFAITAFLYFVKVYFREQKYSFYLLACVFLGLILILRPVNGIILFFTPFLAGSFPEFRKQFAILLKNPVRSGFGILIIAGICCIQCLAWYLQVGTFFVNSYNHTTFNFLKPEWVNVLFSYKKGLLIYTPVLSLGILSLIWFFLRRRYHEVFSWLIFFVILTYITSSWEIWYYGCSYGMRPYIDFYSLFFLPFALMFDSSRLPLKISLIIAGIAFVCINLIQTYQYQNFIIKWLGMDKQEYWTVFLRTDERFKGVVVKQYPHLRDYKLNFKRYFGDFMISENRDSTIIDLNTKRDSIDIANLCFIHLKFSNEFDAANDAKITMLIKDVETGQSFYFASIYLLRFMEKGWNQFQEGLFTYQQDKKTGNKEYEIMVKVSTSKWNADLKNVNLLLYSR